MVSPDSIPAALGLPLLSLQAVGKLAGYGTKWRAAYPLSCNLQTWQTLQAKIAKAGGRLCRIAYNLRDKQIEIDWFMEHE